MKQLKKLKDHVTKKHNEFVDSLESVRTIIEGVDASDELKNKIFSFIDDTSVTESEYVDKKIQHIETEDSEMLELFPNKDKFTNLLMKSIDTDFELFRSQIKMGSSLFGNISEIQQHICEQLKNIFN